MLSDVPAANGNGVDIIFNNSGRMRILDNEYRCNSSLGGGWGYSILPGSTSGGFATYDNIVQGNRALGDTDKAIFCGFHVSSTAGTTFCDNTVSHSERGFHFLYSNDISLSLNHINYHTNGILIEDGDARIGSQIGKGNEWNLDPDACTSVAARCSQMGMINPLNSRFIIPEDNDLPFFPPNDKISPDPTAGIEWFKNEDVNLDYCISNDSIIKFTDIYLTPYEDEVIADTSVLTGAALWDLQRRTYAKLLLFPSLRPTSSPADIYFSSYSGTQIDSFGQVEQGFSSALQLIGTYQPTLDSLRERIQQTSHGLQSLDSITDLSDTLLVTGTYFLSRDSLLDIISISSSIERALEEDRLHILDSLLENTLDLNASIHTTQTWEAARKLLYEIHLRFLLREPMTLTRYEDILSLTQRPDSVAGDAAKGAIAYLAPCDQALNAYENRPEPEERLVSAQPQKHKNISEAIRIIPNPTHGYAEVSLPGADGFLTMVDALGKRVLVMQIEEGIRRISVNLQDHDSGLFHAFFFNKFGRVISSTSVVLQR